MARTPPFELDPHVAIRAPKSLPALMVNAMYDIYQKKRGQDADRFIAAFNIAAWSLTTAGRKKSETASKGRSGGVSWHKEGSEARLEEGTLEIKAGMEDAEKAARDKPEHDKKKKFVEDIAARIYKRNASYYDKTWQQVHGG